MSISDFSPAVFPRITGRSAEAEQERARARGFAAGHAEGLRAAARAAAEQREKDEERQRQLRADGIRQITDAVGVLDAAARALAERERQLLAAATRQLETLAVELAETVVCRELADAEDAARNALHRALAHVDRDEVREVRLHPDDVEVLSEFGAAPASVTLAPDATLARGDAVAVLDVGTVDARLGVAFERIRRVLAEEES